MDKVFWHYEFCLKPPSAFKIREFKVNKSLDNFSQLPKVTKIKFSAYKKIDLKNHHGSWRHFIFQERRISQEASTPK